jgi:hypothetical protein
MFMNISTLENDTTKLSQNFGHHSDSDIALHGRRTDTSTAPLQKLKTHKLCILLHFATQPNER